ncbi:MAG: hypothetical protein QOI65_25, partial [Thermoleophilaceae bacterium]|nr:hypothetical protein [Thermoleophilaceae bacterium]
EGRLSAAARRATRARVRVMRGFAREPAGRALIAGYAGPPELKHWPDRVADALPGSFPARPNALLAALVGGLLALTLWAIDLVLFPPGRRRAGVPDQSSNSA